MDKRDTAKWFPPARNFFRKSLVWHRRKLNEQSDQISLAADFRFTKNRIDVSPRCRNRDVQRLSGLRRGIAAREMLRDPGFRPRQAE